MFRSLTLWPRLWAAAANTLVAFLSLNFVRSNAAVKLGVKMFVFACFLCRVFGTRPELEPSSLSHGLDSSSLAEQEDSKTACSFIFSKCCASRCFLSSLLFYFLLFSLLLKLVSYQLVPYNHGAHFLFEKPKIPSSLILIRFKAFMCAISNKLSRSSTNSVTFSF